jgi:ribosomal protein L11 methyltransferase
LVLANISSAGIAKMAPDLVRALAPGGVLIASGISEGSLDLCRDALLQSGLRVVERMDREGWCALACALA